MDSPSFMGNEISQKQKHSIEYTAQAVSPIVNGEVKLTIGKNSFTAAALFDTVEIAFSEVNELILADYIVTVKADSGDYTFSRLGNWCKPFYDALSDSYNKAVLRSLFINGEPIITARGEYWFTEAEHTTAPATAGPTVQMNVAGAVPVFVFDNNVTILPPNLSARRVPLCFVTGMEKSDFELTLKLDKGASYTCAKLGYDMAPFADAVEKQIRKLREKTLTALKEIDATLTATQASQLAKLMPLGAAAPIGRIAGIAPSFIEALENKIKATRAVESYGVFKELTDYTRIWLGFTEHENRKPAIDTEGSSDGNSTEVSPNNSELLVFDSQVSAVENDQVADPYLIWLIVPSPDEKYAAVEFMATDSATFLYRTGGDFPGFADRLNRALEAICFRREVIRLTDAEMRKPENADYFMASKRTSALRLIRAGYTGRIIHSGVEAWKRKLIEMWSI